MTPLSTPGATVTRGSHVDYDAIVIGTGFGGIYMLHKLRHELGLTVRAYDRERRRRHVVLEPLPRSALGHRGTRLPLLLRPGPAAGLRLVDPLPQVDRHPGLPRARRGPL